jgi:RNA 2',3'-cyclic 3'-phosphodiesterase
VQEDIVALRHRFGFGGREVLPDRLHVTLVQFGRFRVFPCGLVSLISRALSDTCLPLCRTVFDRLVAGRNSMLLVPSEQLLGVRRLQASLADIFKSQGIGAMTNHSIHPHVTLAYGQSHNGAWPVDPISWTERNVMLVESLINKGRHNILCVWTLSAIAPKNWDHHVQFIPA